MTIGSRLRIAIIGSIAVALAATEPSGSVRRLTHSQYNHTVRDLLGDDREIVETASGGWRLADGIDAVVVRPAD